MLLCAIRELPHNHETKQTKQIHNHNADEDQHNNRKDPARIIQALPIFVLPAALLSIDAQLHRTHDEVDNTEKKQQRSVKPGKVRIVIAVRLLEVEVEQHDLGPEIEAAEAQVAVVVAQRDVGVLDLGAVESLDECDEVLKGNLLRVAAVGRGLFGRDEAFAGGEREVGGILDERCVGAHEAQGGLVHFLADAVGAEVLGEYVVPKLVREKELRDRFQENPLVVPDAV